jgi:hypothetical protein
VTSISKGCGPAGLWTAEPPAELSAAAASGSGMSVKDTGFRQAVNRAARTPYANRADNLICFIDRSLNRGILLSRMT